MRKRVAFLATGNELLNGDSFNTSTPRMAERLRRAGIATAEHRTVGDDERRIATAMRELVAAHDALVVTGGLGPTSDDRTRFAAAEVVDRPLVHDEESWRAIAARLASLGIIAHLSNRQQALFPEGARILANPLGTAPGCAIPFGEKWIFLLPGPPRECLPLFEREVVSALAGMRDASQTIVFRLLGAVEADVSSHLDEITAGSGVETGTRWHYPYLDLKITFPAAADERLLARIEAAVTPLLVSREDRTASELFRDILTRPVALFDEATAGLCEATFATPHTRAHLRVVHDDAAWAAIPPEIPRARLTGLQEYWAGHPLPTTTRLVLTLDWNGVTREAVLDGPLRGPEALLLAAEWTALQLWKWLR